MKKEIEENILRSSSIIKESISLSSDIEERGYNNCKLPKKWK